MPHRQTASTYPQSHDYMTSYEQDRYHPRRSRREKVISGVAGVALNLLGVGTVLGGVLGGVHHIIKSEENAVRQNTHPVAVGNLNAQKGEPTPAAMLNGDMSNKVLVAKASHLQQIMQQNAIAEAQGIIKDYQHPDKDPTDPTHVVVTANRDGDNHITSYTLADEGMTQDFTAATFAAAGPGKVDLSQLRDITIFHHGDNLEDPSDSATLTLSYDTTSGWSFAGTPAQTGLYSRSDYQFTSNPVEGVQVTSADLENIEKNLSMLSISPYDN